MSLGEQLDVLADRDRDTDRREPGSASGRAGEVEAYLLQLLLEAEPLARLQPQGGGLRGVARRQRPLAEPPPPHKRQLLPHCLQVGRGAEATAAAQPAASAVLTCTCLFTYLSSSSSSSSANLASAL